MSGEYYVGAIADLISGGNYDKQTYPMSFLFEKSKSEETHTKKKKSKKQSAEETVTKKRKNRNEELEEDCILPEKKKNKNNYSTSEDIFENDEVPSKRKKKDRKRSVIAENDLQRNDKIKKKKKKERKQRYTEDGEEEEQEKQTVLEEKAGYEKENKSSPSKRRKRNNDPSSEKPAKEGARTSDDEGDQLDGSTFGNVPKKKDKELEARTVFIGNVPVSYDKKKMKKLVSQFGSIETIRFRSAPVSNPAYSKRVSFITKDFNPDRQSTNCYVRFKSIEDAHKALSFNGSVIEGLTVRVDIATGKKNRDNSKSVFIGNVPFEAEEEELRQEFCSCGEIEEVRIVRDPVTCAGKGFAYINFASSDGAQLAMELDGKPLRGRSLRVKPCVKKLKAKPGPRNDKHGNKNFKSAKATGKHRQQIRSGKRNFKAPGSSSKYRPQFKGGKKFKKDRAAVPSYAGEQTAEVKTTKKVKKPFITKEERMKRKFAKILSG